MVLKSDVILKYFFFGYNQIEISDAWVSSKFLNDYFGIPGLIRFNEDNALAPKESVDQQLMRTAIVSSF